MADLYPTEEEITLFGEKLKYPGLKDGKFTNGSFTDPKQLASFIPAETLNLILDNLGEAIKSVGLEPNNTDIDQLKKAIDIRTKSEIKQEILENLVVFNIGYTEDAFMQEKILTPDENGIIYSQDINLKQALAKKINKDENEIEIINFNLSVGLNHCYNHYTFGCFYPSTVGFLDDNSNIDKSENVKFALYYQNSRNNEAIDYFIAIQVADDFTKDIKDLQYNSYGIVYRGIEALSQEYKAACLKINISKGVSSGNIIVYSIADLFGISDSFISQYIGASTTPSVDETVYGGYHSVMKKLLVDSPNVYTSSIASFDISSKLMFGDNIKMRIKLISGTSVKALVFRAYNVAVRYRIINYR